MREVVGEFLARRALLDPSRTALICEAERFTFAEFDDLVARTARWLGAWGIGRGDRVAVLLKNGVGFCALYHAAARLGAVLCPVNWRLAADEIHYILVHSQASLLLFDEDFEDAIARMGALPDLRACLPLPYTGFAGVVADSPPADAPCPAEPDDPLLVVYTSGTTGRPKGAILTQRQMFWSSATMAYTVDYRREDIGLIPVPLFHVGGLSFATLFVHIGATAILMPAWDPAAVLRLIEAEGINHFFAVAAMLEGLIADPASESTSLESLRWIMAGGAPVPPALIHRFADRGIPVIQTYGATETAGPAVVVDVANAAARAGAAGLPFFHCDIRIVDDAGATLPPDTPGEIQIRAPHVFQGYWRDADATQKAFSGDWYRSGDIGQIDGDGYLHVLDRKKDMIVSGGENIYPAEVERVLLSMPEISEAAVVGVPDADWGEAVCAVVVPAGDGTVTLEDLRRHCSGQLGKYKLPRQLVLRRDPLPRNATGKLQKHLIRDAIAG